jgi:hypothetical protein
MYEITTIRLAFKIETFKIETFKIENFAKIANYIDDIDSWLYMYNSHI